MRKITVMLVIAILALSTISVDAAMVDFTDIRNHWAKENIDTLINQGVINGYPDGTFRPDQPINVDAFIKLAVTAVGFTSIQNDNSYWATNYISKALELSLIQEGQFDKYTRPITREEMASIAGNALGHIQKTKNIERSFVFILKNIKDYRDVQDQYKQGVVENYYNGLMTGKPEGFDPQGVATRAEATTVILRLLDTNERKPIFIPPTVNEESIKVDADNNMYFDFIRYNDYKNSDRKIAMEKKKIFTVNECPNGERTAIQIMYAMDKIYRESDGYIYLWKIGDNNHPIGIQYEGAADMRSEVKFDIRHSKHEAESAYSIKMEKLEDLSYMDRYQKYQQLFDTMLFYLYEDTFHIAKENILELLIKAENTDISKHTYFMELNERELYVEITLDKIDIQITIKDGERGIEEPLDTQKASNFTLRNMDGKDYNLSDYQGKKVYLKFWNTWCSVCTDGLEELNNLSAQDNDFQVLTIVSPGYNGEMEIQDFIAWYKKLGYDNINILLDVDGKVMEAYEVKAYPTSILINAEGMVIKKESGHIHNDQITEAFEAIK